jgi:hemolysin III
MAKIGRVIGLMKVEIFVTARLICRFWIAAKSGYMSFRFAFKGLDWQIAIMSSEPKPLFRYSLLEDVMSAVSHGIGTALAIVGLVFLILKGVSNDSIYQIVAGSIFGSSMIVAYLSSTLYHSLRIHSVRDLFQKLDHSAIYLLIAGTYTGLMLGALRGGWGWSFFGVAWGIAVLGIILKIFRMGKHPRLSLVSYLAMGWISIIGIYPLWKSLPSESFTLLVAGGLIYSIGAVLYSLKRIPYTHAIWHLFVLGGSITHFFCIYLAYQPEF